MKSADNLFDKHRFFLLIGAVLVVLIALADAGDAEG